jgi:hypothetical protein
MVGEISPRRTRVSQKIVVEAFYRIFQAEGYRYAEGLVTPKA